MTDQEWINKIQSTTDPKELLLEFAEFAQEFGGDRYYRNLELTLVEAARKLANET